MLAKSCSEDVKHLSSNYCPCLGLAVVLEVFAWGEKEIKIYCVWDEHESIIYQVLWLRGGSHCSSIKLAVNSLWLRFLKDPERDMASLYKSSTIMHKNQLLQMLML